MEEFGYLAGLSTSEITGSNPVPATNTARLLVGRVFHYQLAVTSPPDSVISVRSMKVCTLGPVYFHAMKMPLGKQILHVAKTQETNPPYRQGRGVIIRLWKDWRLAVGIWTKKIPDEDTALREALHARDDEMFDEDGELFPRFVRQAALEKVAKDTRDLDEEWEIVDALGLLTLLDECDCEGECDCDDEGGAAA